MKKLTNKRKQARAKRTLRRIIRNRQFRDYMAKCFDRQLNARDPILSGDLHDLLVFRDR